MTLDIREIHGFAEYIRTHHALGLEHHTELMGDDPTMPYDLDADKFAKCEEVGVLAAVGVFDGETLVGYSASLISEHMHHRGVIVALNDLLFLSKGYRGGLSGMKLMAETKRVCKAHGADVMFWCARPGTALSRMLPRLGCKELETIFSEPL